MIPSGILRGLSLWNPHAGFMAIGAKGCESRGRKLGLKPGPLAIASTISVGADYRADLEDDMRNVPSWRRVLEPEGWRNLESMPRGCIVALVWVTAEVLVSGNLMRRAIMDAYGPDELDFGHYADGRVAIHTDRTRLIRIPNPVHVRGSQGVYRVPIDTVRAVVAQARNHANFTHYRAALGAIAAVAD